ncbi:sugar ABC transporter permease [Ignatzschineria cameli]|uniref:Transport permease protein n=1 Tax=Ignatzschineria cameli TaxID=2182793 RepID=A0ABX5KZN4_9GAMM|nr:sugar ABC transporter permease [Ignatzschineria cameli]PWD89133.1 sugar ABC transporter permease [Ignatzschineria cameli]PWD89981.1 sugar ABC transporter permease [Ignatzschineria cameli]
MSRRSPWQIMQDVLFALVLREYLTRFGSRRMGAFWMLFEPAAHMGVMIFIFTVIRARSVPGMDFPMFFLTGMLPFFLMRNIIFKLMDSIGANQALFAYPNIKIFDTYVARVLVELSISSTVYGIFIFIFGFWIGYDVVVAYPLEWLYSLLIGILFAFGLGIIFSVVTIVLPNAKSFIRIMFLPIYLISGVIFPLWIIPQQYLPWVLWNPFAHIVSNIRESVFVTYPVIPGVSQSYPFICTVIVLFVGLGLYRLRRQRLLVK